MKYYYFTKSGGVKTPTLVTMMNLSEMQILSFH